MPDIVASRGEMHNPGTRPGGNLTGNIQQPRPRTPLGPKPGDPTATPTPLSLIPPAITDGLGRPGRPLRAGIVIADERDQVDVSAAVLRAGGLADVTVVCLECPPVRATRSCAPRRVW